MDTSKSYLQSVARYFKVNFEDGNQLPTMILLEDNVENLRSPPVDYEKGALPKVINWKEKELIKYFDMDKRYMATLQSEAAANIPKRKANV